MPFTFKELKLPGVILVEPRVFGDSRGFFMETYKLEDFASAGINVSFPQDNHSRSSSAGTLRGLHYQKQPFAQAKLVRAIKGSIFDVAVDIRKNSPNYGKWSGEILSADNKRMLYIPVGFAHGFCTLEDDCEVVYKCTQGYNAACDRGIIWNDPDIAIKWPVDKPVLSDKDAKLPRLKDADL